MTLQSESDHDNLEEYRNPVFYDAENGGFEIGGPFYEDLAHRTGGHILELACGTGRLTIPLAERGFKMTGVDITPEMLERAKQKAQSSGVDVEWVLADCRDFSLNNKFRLIFTTGNAFQAFLDQESQSRLLQCVQHHLDSDGLFAFETRNPNLSSLSAATGEAEDLGSFTDETGRQVRGSERRWYDPLSQIEHYITYRRFVDESGSNVTQESRISIRYTFPQELESLLFYNGFELLHRYGNFDKSPFTADSPLMVCVCRKR